MKILPPVAALPGRAGESPAPPTQDLQLASIGGACFSLPWPFIRNVLAALAIAAPGLSQSVQVTATIGGAATNVPPGGTVALKAADIGQAVLATVTVRNTGAAATSVTSVSISGPEMTLVLAPGFPVNLNPNASTSFGVQYLPSTGNSVTAQVAISFVTNGQSEAFTLSVSGTAPRLAYSYSFAQSGGLSDLTTGINFPATNIGTPVTAIVNVLNRGSAGATVQSVTVTGQAFQLSGAAGPFQVAVGTQSSFAVVFSPLSAGVNQGLLVLGLPGSNVTFSLSGTGTTTNFTVTYALADGFVNGLSDGATISFPAVDINGSTTATVEIANQGTGAGAVSRITVAGAAFRANGLPAFPANVGAGQSLLFGIVFAPAQTGTYTGTFRIDLPGRTVSGSLAGATAASNISLAYIEPDTNNTLPLRDGSTLPFPTTVAGTSSTVTLVANNSGAGTGVIDSIAVNATAPSAFQLVNLPVLPASVPPGQQLRFGVRFNPSQQQSFSGTLLVSVNGRVTTVNLQALGSGPRFTYAYGVDATPATPGGTMALGEATVGQTTSVTVSVANGGNADGQVSTIAVTGAGFTLSDLPSLPLTLRVGASQNFTVNYAPSQPGTANGRLTIGNDAFTLAANGMGSRLIYSYTNTATVVTVAEGGVVIFPPIEVGKSEKLQFAIKNTGTSAATISSINLAAPSTAFALEQLPVLPFNLDPGVTAAFDVAFSPGTTGGLTATLRVNTSSFTLSGSGTQPAALPSYEFQTPGGGLQPAQQPSVGLTLTSPYPLAIDGTLKLTFASSVFTDDPAIQFATGGRTVNFTIPANGTRALFNGSPTMALQTGTTAGTIVITPSFAMRSGFDMTPPTPDSLTIAIPRAAPQLLSASITSQTATSFTLVLSGYSTTRAMRQLDVQFTPKQGESFSTTRLTIDVTPASAAWYQSTASQGSGGSFLAAIPFVLQNGSTTDDLVHRLQSLSITATNDVGASTAVTVPIL